MRKYTLFTSSKPLRVDLPDMLLRLKAAVLEIDNNWKTQAKTSHGFRKNVLRACDRKRLKWADGPLQPKVIGAFDPETLLAMGLLGMMNAFQRRMDEWHRRGLPELESVDYRDVRTMAHTAIIGYIALEAIHLAQQAGLQGEQLEEHSGNRMEEMFVKYELSLLAEQISMAAFAECLKQEGHQLGLSVAVMFLP